MHCRIPGFLVCSFWKIWPLESVFLSDTRITLGQPEKESTSINKSPTPLMYAWSICTQLHGSTFLDHEWKVVCVKFLNSLHFLHLFIYSSTSPEYPGHHASNFILFLCSRYSTVYIIMYTFYHQFSLCFWGNYQIPITNHSMFYR